MIAALAAALIAGLIFAGASLVRLRFALWPAALLIFFATIGLALDYWGRPVRTWMSPIQINRSWIYLGMGALLAVICVLSLPKLKFRAFPMQALMLLIIGMYAGVLRILHEGPVDGVQTAALAFGTIVPFTLIVASTLDEWEDMTRGLRLIMWANIIWIGAVAVQFFISPKQLMLGQGSRFMGMTANPQHASVILAVTAVVALWLLLNDQKYRYKAMWAVLLGANLILLAWTGSRTGMAMMVIGATAVLYSRVGRAILFLPAAAIVAAILMQFLAAAGIGMELERFTSTENNRAGVWRTLIAAGMRNPIIGVGTGDAQESESSYLLAFAAYGVGMVLLVLGLMAVSGWQMLRLWRVRGRVPRSHRTMVDLIIGYNAMFFAGAIFEGYIMARVTGHISYMLVFACLATAIINRVALEQHWGHDGDHWYDDEYAALDEGDWHDDPSWHEEGARTAPSAG
ncbi:MAG: O-antigen ligase family protein [Planctomycetota bacterium]|nr:O-antigen ligase family protein [Planctomycetota bacterium]